MKARGFTLIEVVIVLAVISILVGVATPMANLFIDQGKRDDVIADLRRISAALEDHYYDQGTFPASLQAAGFYGVYLAPGVNDDVVRDSWGGNNDYVYTLASNPDVAVIHSRGPNGADDSGTGDDILASVPGAAAGGRKTRDRMRVIIEVLGNFLEGGGVVTGVWSVDRVAMGLGAEYAGDGFGTPFTLDAASYVLRSAGPDRVAGNADDLTS